MADVKTFCLWFIQQLPTFLMSEPIKYFVGIGFLLCVVIIVDRITRLK